MADSWPNSVVGIVFISNLKHTGAVHTSAKARLTTVAIWIGIGIRIPDPIRYQNLTICSLVHCQPSLKITCKFVVLRNVANRQTDGQTDRQTDRQRRLHILLLGGDNQTRKIEIAVEALSVIHYHQQSDQVQQCIIKNTYIALITVNHIYAPRNKCP